MRARRCMCACALGCGRGETREFERCSRHQHAAGSAGGALKASTARPERCQSTGPVGRHADLHHHLRAAQAPACPAMPAHCAARWGLCSWRLPQEAMPEGRPEGVRHRRAGERGHSGSMHAGAIIMVTSGPDKTTSRRSSPQMPPCDACRPMVPPHRRPWSSLS